MLRIVMEYIYMKDSWDSKLQDVLLKISIIFHRKLDPKI